MPDNWTITGSPDLSFTHVPAYGTTEDLKGLADGVRPSHYRVAVFIYRGGWYNKPTWDHPLTTIGQDGRWWCDVTTGANDQYATKIGAFLVPADYDPPLMHGEPNLPADLYSHAVDHLVQDRNPL
jgi:hypothetical protein